MPQISDLEFGKFEEFSNYAHRIILTEHARIHEGKAFMAGILDDAVADAASLEILIQAVNAMHVIFNVSASGDCEVHRFEGTTFSATGGALTAFNKNRFSAIESGGTITSAPTLTADGTELPPGFIPGGSGGNSLGGQDGGYEREIILASSTDYLFRMTNISGLAAIINGSIEWYEPAAVAP